MTVEAPVRNGFVAVVKQDCPTCRLVVPVLQQIAASHPLVIATQDDPSFPDADATDDTSLELSLSFDIETVPTLLRVEDGVVAGRTEGWSRERWESLVGIAPLGDGLPDHRPGCGSRTLDADVVLMLRERSAAASLRSRRITLGSLEDDVEACIERGWSDGLPVVPPTPVRIAQMLEGTTRDPSEVVAVIPPDLVECTVEKIAVNAVLAGCRPEYLPVVLACVEAACTDE